MRPSGFTEFVLSLTEDHTPTPVERQLGLPSTRTSYFGAPMGARVRISTSVAIVRGCSPGNALLACRLRTRSLEFRTPSTKLRTQTMKPRTPLMEFGT